MRILPFIICAGLLGLMSSCKVLTRSQVKNISAFAETTKAFSDYPGELLRKRSKLMLEEKMLRTADMPDSGLIKQSVRAAHIQYKTEMAFADSFDIGFTLLKQYAILLEQLSSPEHVEALMAEKEAATTRLDKILDIADGRVFNSIPTGVGSAIAEGLFFAGKQITRTQQAAAIRKYVPVGEQIMQAMVTNLTKVLDGDMKALLQSDSLTFSNTFTNTVFQQDARIGYSSVAQYSSGILSFESLEAYRKQCLKAVRAMAKAHTLLDKAVKQKIEMKELLKETKEFAASVKQLYSLYKKIGQPVKE